VVQNQSRSKHLTNKLFQSEFHKVNYYWETRKLKNKICQEDEYNIHIDYKFKFNNLWQDNKLIFDLSVNFRDEQNHLQEKSVECHSRKIVMNGANWSDWQNILHFYYVIETLYCTMN